MAQTAVEWLWRWMNDNQEATIEEGNKAFEQAKAMEKEQIIDAFADSRILAITNNCNSGEQYYNETYKGGEQ
jgi:hypothetical protein